MYDLAMALVVWTVLAPWTALRAVLGGSTLDELRERLGRWTPPPSTDRDRPLLVHAVSAGEVAAAVSLISAISSAAPDLRVVLTTGNPEGRAAAESLSHRFPAIRAVSFLPWDRRRTMLAWLRRVDPCAVAVVEVEIWPALFRSCETLGIPVLVASGRIGAAHVRRYRRGRAFFSRVLEACTWIGVQSERDREAFLSIGAPPARVEVAGNLKMDRETDTSELPGPWCSELDTVAQRAELVVGGSTHHPEEQWLVAALRRFRLDGRTTHLVLAPRHPRRARQVHELAHKAGSRVALWSEGPISDWDVLVVDQMGPLSSLYRWADVAVIGGSLATGGGHNPIEAAAVGRAVLIGHAHAHVRDIVCDLERVGGIKVLDANADPRDSLVSALAELLADPELRLGMGERAARYCQSQRGAAAAHARAILSCIVSNDRASTGTARGPS